jgi:hypothetical protein
MRLGIPQEAVEQMGDQFLHSPYIGSAQIWNKEETGYGKHKFFYLGYYDLFGVRMPPMGPNHRPEFQIWPLAWVRKRIRSLDSVIEKAMAGEFVRTRHNIQLQKRAKQHGRKFYRKPKQYRPTKTVVATEKGKLPKRRRKHKRRALTI